MTHRGERMKKTDTSLNKKAVSVVAAGALDAGDRFR